MLIEQIYLIMKVKLIASQVLLLLNMILGIRIRTAKLISLLIVASHLVLAAYCKKTNIQSCIEWINGIYCIRWNNSQRLIGSLQCIIN